MSRWLALPLAAVAPITGGCLDRTVTVTSTPPGALVTLNDVEVGRTPVTTAFTFFGDYDVHVRREGCEPLTTHENLIAPIWEWVPFDLMATAIPIEFHSRDYLHYDLTPTAPIDAAGETALIDRAKVLRERVTTLTK